MTRGLFRVRLRDGSTRLARGDVEAGPQELLEAGVFLDGLLGQGPRAILEAVRGGSVAASARSASSAGEAVILAPIENQEVWAAGVTYERSRDARMEESAEPSVYDHVYDAVRPELFFKSPGWRVRGPGESIGVRADSTWDVPEPELALVFTSGLELAGYVIGNDMSSRSIEGENPLYLPQAKVYDGSCALGPCIVPVGEVEPPFDIHLRVLRDGETVVDDRTSSGRLRRSVTELAEHLGSALTFPVGTILLTGTGVVPDPHFTLRHGDEVRVEIEGLGELVNPVVQVGRGATPAA
jgi:2-dehydro-3-deoxy-D-arabinonate dehydratase